MPLLRNKYQPYFPDPDTPSLVNCEGEYCHPIQLGDTIYAQFYQTPCAANLIADPNFSAYTLGAEELTNGTFTGNANGWETVSGTLPNDNWAYDSNNIEHTPGSTVSVFQTGLALTAGYYYIEIDITRVSGSVRVRMGDGAASSVTDYFDTTGTHTYILYYSDTLDQTVQIEPNTDDDFEGWINSISVKEYTPDSWTGGSGGWTFSDEGGACHVDGSTDLLEETVSDYINANEYYKITVNVDSVTAGTCDVYIADVNVGTISANGEFTYWGTPTVTGVVSFDPSSDFTGCITYVQLWELKNDHDAKLYRISDNLDIDLSPYLEYYEDYVTLIFNIAELDIADLSVEDCFYIEIYDACTISGDELVVNGDFATGDYTGWTRNNGSHQYNINGSNQLEFIFDPLTGETDLVTNGDFGTGDFTGWTAGVNWAVVGNKAQHTAGSTATLYQTIVIAAPPAPPTPEQYWVQFVISNRTAGSIRVTWGTTQSNLYTSNDTITVPLTPNTSGSVDLIFTPSSDFDGEIDDIVLVASNTIWSASPYITNSVNTLIVEGNYQLGFDLISSTNSVISTGGMILGQVASVDYETAAATYSKSITDYVPGAQQVRMLASFRSGNNWIPGTITVDNISLIRVEPFEATYTSECLDFREVFDDPTRLVQGYCDEKNLGFEFTNTGFVLQQRIYCRSMNPRYPQSVDISKFGSGDGKISYSEIEKYWQFVTGYMSETAHDSMALMRICDHFLIGTAQDNGTEYMIDNEEYTVQWRGEGDYQLAYSIMSLRVKDSGQVFNRNKEAD